MVQIIFFSERVSITAINEPIKESIDSAKTKEFEMPIFIGAVIKRTTSLLMKIRELYIPAISGIFSE